MRGCLEGLMCSGWMKWNTHIRIERTFKKVCPALYEEREQSFFISALYKFRVNVLVTKQSIRSEADIPNDYLTIKWGWMKQLQVM